MLRGFTLVVATPWTSPTQRCSWDGTIFLHGVLRRPSQSVWGVGCIFIKGMCSSLLLESFRLEISSLTGNLTKGQIALWRDVLVAFNLQRGVQVAFKLDLLLQDRVGASSLMNNVNAHSS